MSLGVICVLVGQPPASDTVAPAAAAAAVLPSWPRTTVQLLLPAPLAAVTSSVSAPSVA